MLFYRKFHKLEIAIYEPFMPVFNNFIDIFPIQKLFLYRF